MITVTDTNGTLTINDSNSVESPEKAKVVVLAFGTTVQIWWDETHYVSDSYLNYTIGGTIYGTAALAAAAIAAMLNTGGGAASNSKTVAYTVGIAGSGADYEFTAAADALEQSIQLGATAIVPANSPITSIVAKCTTGISDGSPTTATADVGNTSGGDELISTVSLEVANDVVSVSAVVVANTSASSVYFSITPGVNWITLTAGIWKVWVSYNDNSAN
jgi:hypothetical protein